MTSAVSIGNKSLAHQVNTLLQWFMMPNGIPSGKHGKGTSIISTFTLKTGNAYIAGPRSKPFTRYIIYIYILIICMPRQSLSRILFSLCGFSGAGLKSTVGPRVMDSMTHFWCQKVGLSRLFCVILRHISGLSNCDRQRAKSAFEKKPTYRPNPT